MNEPEGDLQRPSGPRGNRAGAPGPRRRRRSAPQTATAALREGLPFSCPLQLIACQLRRQTRKYSRRGPLGGPAVRMHNTHKKGRGGLGRSAEPSGAGIAAAAGWTAVAACGRWAAPRQFAPQCIYIMYNIAYTAFILTGRSAIRIAPTIAAVRPPRRTAPRFDTGTIPAVVRRRDTSGRPRPSGWRACRGRHLGISKLNRNGDQETAQTRKNIIFAAPRAHPGACPVLGLSTRSPSLPLAFAGCQGRTVVCTSLATCLPGRGARKTICQILGNVSHMHHIIGKVQHRFLQ